MFVAFISSASHSSHKKGEHVKQSTCTILLSTFTGVHVIICHCVECWEYMCSRLVRLIRIENEW